MSSPSTRLVALAAGATLVIAGSALALVAAKTFPPPVPPAGSTTTIAAVDAPDPTAAPPASEPPAVEMELETTPTTSEPEWRAKQREAEQRVLSTGEGGGVGVVALISFDPTVRADPEPQPTPSLSAPTTRLVLAGGATPLQGVWAGKATELAAYLLAAESSPSFTVPPLTLAEYYVRWAAQVGLRADVLWAQMLHETGFGRYGGDVTGAQNNFAGIGATGNGAPGISFPTAEAGVKAHVAHMAAYVFATDPAPWTNSSTDPRYDNVSPRGTARTLSDLDGRWAVPGDGYGARIEQHVRAINSR